MSIQTKILFFAPAYSPAESSAAAVRCAYLNRALNKNQISSEVWSTSQTPQTKKLFFSLASNRRSFFTRLVCEVALGLELFIRLFFYKIKSSDPKLIVLSSPPYITCWLAALACTYFRLPYALDIRDPYPEVYFSQNLFSENSALGQMQIRLARFFYKNSCHIFTVTEGCKNIIKNYVTTSSAITVVRNGYSEEDFASSLPKRPKFTCVFHGNMGYMQNIALLKNVIEKAQTLAPEISFVAAGSGPQAHLLSSLKTPNFDFLGEINYEKAIHLIKTCHLGLSFRLEGAYSQLAFPVKVYEYIGAEIPTLQTPVSAAMTEIVEKKLGLMLTTTDPEELVKKIIELANSPTAYQNFVENIKAQKANYSRLYSSKVFVEKIKALITY